jgi:hypothetical protein
MIPMFEIINLQKEKDAKNVGLICTGSENDDFQFFIKEHYDDLKKLENDWYLLINKQQTDLFNLKYVGEGVFFTPQKNEYTGNYTVNDVIQNEHFKFPFWISKKENLLNTQKQRDSKFLELKCPNIELVLEAVNHLQQTKIIINKNDFAFFYDTFQLVKTSSEFSKTE